MIRFHLLGPLELADEAGRDVRPVLTQPKRLAVLAFLAARPAGEFVRRDTILGVFWPDLGQEAARRSLRQTLHVLRSQLGPDAISTRGDDDVAVNGGAVDCDVARFLAAVAEARDAEAVEAYRGDLLGGFFLTGGNAEFEHWLDGQRTSLRDAAEKAAARLTGAAEAAGDLGGAAGWARRAVAIAPDDEVALRRLLRLLQRMGDGAGALRAYEAFARRLSRELDHAPSAETQALVAQIRASAPPPAVLREPAIVAPAAQAAPPVALEAPPPSASRRWLAGIAVGALVLLLAGATTLVLSRRTEHPVLAVGEITDADSEAPELAARILPQLIASDLARIGGLAVLRPARVEEVAGHLASATGQSPSATEAARSAGATDLVEGVLYRLRGDTLRLDLRRVDVHSAVVRDAVTLVGVDPFTLADSAAARFAARFGLERPAGPLAAVTSTSTQAQVLYREGLRAYYRDQNYEEAARLFGDAVAADSSFAMAAYYLSNALGPTAPERGREALALANRMASHATPREALLIRAAWGEERGDPAWPELADSLAAAFPADPESRTLAAEGRAIRGDFADAIADYRDAIHLDSLSLRDSAARCLACDAYGGLIGAYLANDSLPAAARSVRDWIAVQPRSPRVWMSYAMVLERAGRLDSAVAARQMVDRLLGRNPPPELVRGFYAIRSGDLAAAESLLAGPAADPRNPDRAEAQWWLLLALRNAGRPGAAVAIARALARDTTGRSYNENVLASLPLAQVLFEAGDLAEAARLFGAAGVHSPKFRAAYPGQAERDRAWALAQRAGVAAAQRDTAALARLADSVAAHGDASPWGRDRRLASYVRGLRLELGGRLAAAADTFRNAIYSPTEGYTRVNLELARTLMALGRPADAVPVLQSALRGGLDASNFYVTRGELELAAGDAFAAAGRKDSAAAHYAWIARAWRDAEPAFRERWRAAAAYGAGAGGMR